MLRFNLEDTAVILIDHQVGTNTCAATTPLALLQRNVIIPAKFAKGTGAIVAELVKNWASPAGTVAFPLLT